MAREERAGKAWAVVATAVVATEMEPTRELSADELIRQRDADKKLSIGLLGWAKSWLW